MDRKSLYYYFKQKTGEISHDKTLRSLKKEHIWEKSNLFWDKNKTTPKGPTVLIGNASVVYVVTKMKGLIT